MSKSEVILEDIIKDNNSKSINFKIELITDDDYNRVLAKRINQQNTDFMHSLFDKLIEFQNNGLDISDLEKNLNALFLKNSNWDWYAKTTYFKKEMNYLWFYIINDDNIEAISIVSFPKDSYINPANSILCIEYIYVSAWNRSIEGLYARKTSGFGTKLVKEIIKYVVPRQSGLSYGLCLDSLPDAVGFYDKLNMSFIKDKSGSMLSYYEMEEQITKEFIKEN
jgi:hypothetical protein